MLAAIDMLGRRVAVGGPRRSARQPLQPVLGQGGQFRRLRKLRLPRVCPAGCVSDLGTFARDVCADPRFKVSTVCQECGTRHELFRGAPGIAATLDGKALVLYSTAGRRPARCVIGQLDASERAAIERRMGWHCPPWCRSGRAAGGLTPSAPGGAGRAWPRGGYHPAAAPRSGGGGSSLPALPLIDGALYVK